MKYNLNNPEGQRIVDVKVVCSECEVPEYLPLDNDKFYDIVLSNYLLNGGDGYTMIRDNAVQKHVVGEYIKHLVIWAGHEGSDIHRCLRTGPTSPLFYPPPLSI